MGIIFQFVFVCPSIITRNLTEYRERVQNSGMINFKVKNMKKEMFNIATYNIAFELQIKGIPL